VENFFEILVFNEKFFQSPQVRTQNFSKRSFAKKKYFFFKSLSSLSSPLKKNFEYKEKNIFF